MSPDAGRGNAAVASAQTLQEILTVDHLSTPEGRLAAAAAVGRAVAAGQITGVAGSTIIKAIRAAEQHQVAELQDVNAGLVRLLDQVGEAPDLNAARALLRRR